VALTHFKFKISPGIQHLRKGRGTPEEQIQSKLTSTGGWPVQAGQVSECRDSLNATRPKPKQAFQNNWDILIERKGLQKITNMYKQL
jgi:hypothetical protein